MKWRPARAFGEGDWKKVLKLSIPAQSIFNKKIILFKK
jgi:hypothetical protein